VRGQPFVPASPQMARGASIADPLSRRSAGTPAFSLTCLLAQRDAGIGRWRLLAAASSSPGGLGRSGGLCPGVPGLGRRPGPDPLDDPGVPAP